MPMPNDWKIELKWEQNGLLNLSDPRGTCPHCRNASTFAIQATVAYPGNYRQPNIGTYWAHMLLRCQSASCGRIVFVWFSFGTILAIDRVNGEFFIFPSRTIDRPHPSVPTPIADDWIEAQKAMEAGAPKAAAVMCRRVLYGAILDKKCKEHPLREGLKELIQGQRLPAVFDDWLPAIKDDGHDAAHPHRALQIDPLNVAETIEYTAELLRYLYIEPYEFQQRKARSSAKPQP